MTSERHAQPPIWGVWTRRRTRRQAVVWAAGFLGVGLVGLLVWPPLAVAGFLAAGVTAFNIALGATRDGYGPSVGA